MQLYDMASFPLSNNSSTGETYARKTINSEFHIRHRNHLAIINVLYSIPSTSIEARKRNGEIKNHHRKKLNCETVSGLI